MNQRSFRNGLRFRSEFVPGVCYIARPSDIEPGKAVKMPSKAIYRRSSDGKSLVRTNKPLGTKKERRRARAAAKLAAQKPVEQVQAELAAEGGA